MQGPAQLVAQAARGADAMFIPEGPEVVPSVVQALSAAGLNLKRVQLLGTGLWDDPRIFAEAALQGGWYAAPDSAGFRNFSARYRARYGQDPVRTATLAYDAVALVAALVKTQGAAALQRAGADQSVGLRRHRRAVPLPHRRHQPARSRGDAGDAERRPDHQPAAARLRRLGHLIVSADAYSAGTSVSRGLKV